MPVCAWLACLGALAWMGLAWVVIGGLPQPAAAQANAESAAADPLAAAPAEARAHYDSAFREMLADPADLDKSFAFAKAAIEVGDYEGAIAALERMLFINPDLPRVRLELGALYFRLGSYEAARSYLVTAVAAPGVPDDVRERVDGFLAEIDRRLSRHRFSGSIYAGVRWQSNAASAPGGTGVRALGLDATLDDQFTAEADENLFVVGNAKHSYLMQSLAGAAWETTGLLYYARQRKQRRVDLNLFEATTGPRLPMRMPGLFDEGNVRGYLIGTFVGLGGERYYSGLGAGLEFNALPAPRTAVQVDVESRSKQYHSSGSRPRNDEQTGYTSSVEARLRQGLSEDLSVSVALAAQGNRTQFSYNDYTEYAATVGLDYLYRPGLLSDWLPPDLPWATSLSAARVLTGYGGPDPTVDPNVTRQDHDWRFSMITAVPLSQDWSGIVTVGRTQRTSSLPNFKFTNTYVSLGASWRF